MLMTSCASFYFIKLTLEVREMPPTISLIATKMAGGFTNMSLLKVI